jgi:GT2 family glycosyltransferase
LLNNDIKVIHSDWLDEMVAQACRPEIGCVGAKLYYPDNTIQHAGVILGIKGTASHAHKYFPKAHLGYFNRLVVTHNVSAVTAACLVMRKELFEQVGGFDEVNLKVAYNDVDLCLKVLACGYRNLWTPYAELIHYESKSRGKKRSWWQRRKLRKEARFLQKKWGKLLQNDPCYNPNLTLEAEDFSLKNKDE